VGEIPDVSDIGEKNYLEYPENLKDK
jgi:hypothetical protein